MRVVQFHRPGHGPRTGVVRDGTVYDVTAEAGDALSLLLAHHAGVPEPCGVPAGTLAALDVAPHEDVAHLLMPVFPSEVWGAGVTYKKSAEFRDEDATSSKGIYDQVYVAARPELFYKGRAVHCAGPNGAGGIRVDSDFTAPEPELAIVVAANGDILGYTLCDDVSAWDIERANPLYLPQSKIFRGCVVIGPTIVTPDEIPDPASIVIRATITRGDTVIFDDHCGVDRMKRTLPELVHFLRLNNPIQDGTVLTTGTGIIVTQDQALHEHDIVTLDAPVIGTLRHTMHKLPVDA